MGDAIIKMNIEHRTSNIEHRMKNRGCFDFRVVSQLRGFSCLMPPCGGLPHIPLFFKV